MLPHTSELKAQEIAGPSIIYLTFLHIIYLAIRQVVSFNAMSTTQQLTILGKTKLASVFLPVLLFLQSHVGPHGILNQSLCDQHKIFP